MSELSKQEIDTIKKLHQIKNEINQAMKAVNDIPGLEIQVEVLEMKSDGKPTQVTGLEISVKQEIYP